jgi:hypothetical protein
MSTEQLYKRVAHILEEAHSQVARAVNTAMVHAYWHVGREIVEVEQAGKARAGYGDQVIEQLSTRLSAAYGRGFSVRNLWSMRQFFLAFPRGSAASRIPQTASAESRRLPEASAARSLRKASTSKPVASPGSAGSKLRGPARNGEPAGLLFPPELAWSHYLVLMRVTKETARAFYEIEATRGSWLVRQLERQIGAQLFERLARHRSPDEVLALARRGQEVGKPQDVIKDPFVLEFLDLGEPARLRERNVEQAIIDRLKTLERRGLLSRSPGVARSLRVLVPAEVLPGSDFGSAARRARTPASADARSPSPADAAVTATLAVLEVVMPRLPSATRRSSGSKVVIEVARAVYESLCRLGMEDGRAAEVSQRVSAEHARWERGEGRHRRSSARVDAPLNDPGMARR